VLSMANGIYKPASAYRDDGVPCLRMYNIEHGAVAWRNIKRMQLSSAELEQYLLLPGDLLVNRVNSRELVGKTAVCGVTPEPAVFESKNIRVRLRLDRIDPRFVGLWLQLDSTRAVLTDGAKQTVGMATITQPMLAALLIPFPPLAEQERVVEKVEALLAQVNAAQERLTRVREILKRFRQSTLAAACSGRLTEDWRAQQAAAQPLEPVPDDEVESLKTGLSQFAFPPEWRTTRLGALSSLVTSGSRGWAQYYSDHGALFLRSQDIKTDKLDLCNVARVTPPHRTEGMRTRVEPQDLLITITGANVARAAVVDRPTGQAYVSQHLGLVRLIDSPHARWLHLWLTSPLHGRRFLLAAAYGAGKPGLNLDHLRELPVALPPLPEQAEIVRRVDALFTAAERIEQRLATSAAHSKKFPEAALAAAFRGELR
jgi:type I restriction enzyme S subunit